MRSLAWIALLAVGFGGLGGCGVELEHGLDERQANQIASILDENGIIADKARDDGTEGWKIVVPQNDRARSVRLLESYDLPRRGRRGIEEMMRERSLLPSAGEEHLRLEAARGAELERTLERVPGIVCARVHLALPDPSVFDKPAAAHASVLLRTHGTAAITEAQVRALVGGAVAGLQPDAVAVVMTTGDTITPPSTTEQVGPLAVARGERGRVVAVTASALGLVIALGVALLATAMRLRRDHSAASKRNG